MTQNFPSMYVEMNLPPDDQANFLIQNPGHLELHWRAYAGIFAAVNDASPGCGCPIQLRELDRTCGIRGVDRILDGGDDDGNRIPKSYDHLVHRWHRAGSLPNTDRIRRKILAPFVQIRKILDARNQD